MKRQKKFAVEEDTIEENVMFNTQRSLSSVDSDDPDGILPTQMYRKGEENIDNKKKKRRKEAAESGSLKKKARKRIYISIGVAMKSSWETLWNIPPKLRKKDYSYGVTKALNSFPEISAKMFYAYKRRAIQHLGSPMLWLRLLKKHGLGASGNKCNNEEDTLKKVALVEEIRRLARGATKPGDSKPSTRDTGDLPERLENAINVIREFLQEQIFARNTELVETLNQELQRAVQIGVAILGRFGNPVYAPTIWEFGGLLVRTSNIFR